MISIISFRVTTLQTSLSTSSSNAANLNQICNHIYKYYLTKRNNNNGSINIMLL